MDVSLVTAVPDAVAVTSNVVRGRVVVGVPVSVYSLVAVLVNDRPVPVNELVDIVTFPPDNALARNL
jgi:hypothetical protein